VFVSVDWQKAPKKDTTGTILISGTGKDYRINVPIRYLPENIGGFVENEGVISIDADAYSKVVDGSKIKAEVVPNLGRTASSLIAKPFTAERVEPGKDAALIEYEFTLFNTGDIHVDTYISPTQDFKKQGGIHYAVAIDDEQPQLINMNKGEIKPDWQYAGWWTQSVGDHIKTRRSTHKVLEPGMHRLKIWLLEPGVVLQKIVIDAGGLKDSYLGPMESTFIEN
jgi:hypothetical protein